MTLIKVKNSSLMMTIIANNFDELTTLLKYNTFEINEDGDIIVETEEDAIHLKDQAMNYEEIMSYARSIRKYLIEYDQMNMNAELTEVISTKHKNIWKEIEVINKICDKYNI